jgi:hypothetical protein
VLIWLFETLWDSWDTLRTQGCVLTGTLWLLIDSVELWETLQDYWLTLWDSEWLLMINSVRLCGSFTRLINSERLCVTDQLCETLWDFTRLCWLTLRLVINSETLWDFGRLYFTQGDSVTVDYLRLPCDCWLLCETLCGLCVTVDYLWDSVRARLLINSERLWKTLKDFARLLINSVRLWETLQDCWLTLRDSVRLLSALRDSVRLCVTVD